MAANKQTTNTQGYTCAHLHGIDGSLRCGSSQRSGHEPLVGLDLPGLTGKHLLILMKHSGDKEELQQDAITVEGHTALL